MAATKKNSKKTVYVITTIIIVFVIFFVILGTLFFNKKLANNFSLIIDPSKKSAVVVLTEDGYSPEDITISKGTTLTFKTTRNSPYWPASNLHPTHEIYPEFDPQEPIEAAKTWSYRFDKVGTWHFHDHLAPYYTGSITVLGRK